MAGLGTGLGPRKEEARLWARAPTAPQPRNRLQVPELCRVSQGPSFSSLVRSNFVSGQRLKLTLIPSQV